LHTTPNICPTLVSGTLELELFSLYISCTAVRHILQSRPFFAYVDHSSLVQIRKSKHQPPTLRLQKLLERLSHYTFNLAYKKGSDLVLPVDDESEWERIHPIAFPCQQCLKGQLLGHMRNMNIPIAQLFPENNKSTDPIPAELQAEPPVDQLQQAPTVDNIEIPDGVDLQPNDVNDNQMQNPVPVPMTTLNIPLMRVQRDTLTDTDMTDLTPPIPKSATQTRP
jgi:hypothetical protein